MPDLSIIFVNWNSTDYLIESVESIYANTKSIQFEIIVVDNCSPKGDVGEVKRRFPDVLLIESPVNLGFSGANNLGFRASRGEFVVFLNPDTLLINPAFDACHTNSTCGEFSCKILILAWLVGSRSGRR